MIHKDLVHVIPRWEWRCFSNNGPALRVYLKSQSMQTLPQSNEVYVLTSNPNLNMKFRNGIIDIKQRLEIHEHGYEKWLPIFKSAIPLGQSAAEEMLRILGMDDSLHVDGKDEEALISSFSGINGTLPVPLTKIRSKTEIEGITAEFTQLNMNQNRYYSFALEHENASLITKVRSELKIDINTNENYPEAIKRFLSSGKLE